MDDDKAARLHFGTLVRRLRESHGHATARAFFESQGGDAFFGCTYRSYLNVESGYAVPNPHLVERLATALRVPLNEDTAKGFAVAYLRILLGFDDLLEFAVQALAADGSASTAPLGRPDAEYVRLTPAQAALLYESAESYWCFTLLASTPERRRARELAPRLELPEPVVRHALGRLEGARLASREKDGYRRTKSGARLVFPKDETGRGSAALRRHWDAAAKRRGGARLLHHPFLMLAPETELRNYFPYLSQTVLAADLYATPDDCPDAAFFLVEATVERLFRF